MKDTEIIIQLLNDLIYVNNDRAAGYVRAAGIAQKTDADLPVIFYRLADESRQFAGELSNEVIQLGGKPASGSKAIGMIYRAWLDLKANFIGHDHASLLSACVYAEEAVQRSYSTALESGIGLHLRQLIATQKSVLKTSHDLVKKFRDIHEVVQ